MAIAGDIMEGADDLTVNTFSWQELDAKETEVVRFFRRFSLLERDQGSIWKEEGGANDFVWVFKMGDI